jgi:hypothetical protein
MALTETVVALRLIAQVVVLGKGMYQTLDLLRMVVLE